MKKYSNTSDGVLMSVLAAIVIIIVSIVVGGLVIWGLGNFIIWAFNVNFEWNLFRGMATYLVIWVMYIICKKAK